MIAKSKSRPFSRLSWNSRSPPARPSKSPTGAKLTVAGQSLCLFATTKARDASFTRSANTEDASTKKAASYLAFASEIDSR